jgi:hypothetical protein
MTFNVPASAGEKPENRFEFTLPGAKKRYSIPKMDFLTGEHLLLVSQVEDQEFGADSVKALFQLTDELTDAPIRKLAMDQLVAFYDAWGSASAVTPPESDGSPALSESTDSKSNTPS